MTDLLSKEAVADIYTAVVHVEAQQIEDDRADAAFELECLFEKHGGSYAVMRRLIDMMRADERELLQRREAAEKPVFRISKRRINENCYGWNYEPLVTLPEGVHDVFLLPPLPVVPSTQDAVAWRWFDGRGYNSTTDKKQADELLKDGVAVEALGPLQALPVVLDEVITVAQRLVDRYIRNKGTESEFICCITPGRSSIGIGGVWGDWRKLDAALSACRAAMLQSGGSEPSTTVTAEHQRVIEMLLSVCGAAFELADDTCQQEVDGEQCITVPHAAFQKLSDALDEIEYSLPTEDADRPDVFLAWAAMPRAALKSILQSGGKS